MSNQACLEAAMFAASENYSVMAYELDRAICDDESEDEVQEVLQAA